MTEFEPDKHRKYDAEYYFQSNTLIPMQEAPRAEIANLAYNHFLAGIQAVVQMDPLDAIHIAATVKVPPEEVPDATPPPVTDGDATGFVPTSGFPTFDPSASAAFHSWRTGDFPTTSGFGTRPPSAVTVVTQKDVDRLSRKARWERLITERNAAVSAYRFRERLLARVAGYANSAAEDPMRIPSIGRAGIREATYKYLTTAPEAECTQASLIMAGGACALYLYMLGNQVLGVLDAKDGPFIYNRFLELSKLDALWAAFVMKECFLISVPVYYILAACLLAVVAILVGPILIAYHTFAIKGKPSAEKAFRKAVYGDILPAVKSQVILFASLMLNLSTSWRVICIAEQIYNKKVNASVKDFEFTLTTVANLMFTLVLLMMLGHQDEEEDNMIGILSSLAISLLSLLRAMVHQSLELNDLCDVFSDVNENRLSKFETALLMKKVMERLLDTSIQYNFVQHFYTGTHDKLEPDMAPLTHIAEDVSQIEEGMVDIPEDLAIEFGHDGRDLYKQGRYTGKAQQSIITAFGFESAKKEL